MPFDIGWNNRSLTSIHCGLFTLDVLAGVPMVAPKRGEGGLQPPCRGVLAPPLGKFSHLPGKTYENWKEFKFRKA